MLHSGSRLMKALTEADLHHEGHTPLASCAMLRFIDQIVPKWYLIKAMIHEIVLMGHCKCVCEYSFFVCARVYVRDILCASQICESLWLCVSKWMSIRKCGLDSVTTLQKSYFRVQYTLSSSKLRKFLNLLALPGDPVLWIVAILKCLYVDILAGLKACALSTFAPHPTLEWQLTSINLLS